MRSGPSFKELGSQRDVEFGVDVDALVLGHDEESDPTAETIVVLLVDLGTSDVERTGLAVTPSVLSEVLSAGSRSHVVCRGGRMTGLPDEGRLLDHPDHRVDAGGGELGKGPGERVVEADGGGRLQQHHCFRPTPVPGDFVDGVADDRFSRSGVLREVSGSDPRHTSSGGRGDLRDLLVVC